MLKERNLPKYLWADTVSIACYVLNITIIRSMLKLTPYKLFKGRKPNITHLRIFGSKCFVLNNGKEILGKFDFKADEAILIGYSLTSKAYRVYNKRILCVEESMHVTFDEYIDNGTNYMHSRKCVYASDSIDEEEKSEEIQENETLEVIMDPPRVESMKEWKTPRNVSTSNIFVDITRGVST